MLAAAPVHKILFFLSVLFGTESSMVSQESVLHIDREVRTGRITYRGVRVEKESAGRMPGVLDKLEGKERFAERAKGIELSMVMFRSRNKMLSVEVFFAYEKEKRMRELFGLTKDEKGRIAFRPRKKESIDSTNGMISDGMVHWEKGKRKVMLGLEGKPLGKEKRKEMKGVRYIRQ
ncbi:MAG: hypothetical protein ABEH38_04070 [Flavobacteriales bacterium]